MIAAVVLMFIAWLAMAAALVINHRAHSLSHMACHRAMINVMLVSYSRTDAEALRSAAHDWDSIEEQGRLKALANEKYRAGGPSMPVIWMLDRADRIESEKAAQALAPEGAA